MFIKGYCSFPPRFRELRSNGLQVPSKDLIYILLFRVRIALLNRVVFAAKEKAFLGLPFLAFRVFLVPISHLSLHYAPLREAHPAQSTRSRPALD
jgi:hypothetical protein